MTETPKESQALGRWQWLVVIALALIAGCAGGLGGGLIGGGVDVMINDESPTFFGDADDAAILRRVE